MRPPAHLLADCPETPVVMEVNADLVRKLRALRVDLQSCNADKAGLRDWFNSLAR